MAPLKRPPWPTDWLGRQAVRRPQAPCLRWAGAVYSFRAISRRVTLLCAELAPALAETRPPQVGIVSPDPFLTSLLVLACARMGWPVTVLNPDAAKPTLDAQAAQVGVTLLLVTADGYEELGRKERTVRYVNMSAHAQEGQAHSAPPLPPTPPVDLRRLQGYVFTSGSTGQAKAVPFTFGQFYWSTVTSAYRLGYAHTDCWLHCLPLHHIGGLALLFRAVLMGFCLDLQAGFDADRVLAGLRTQQFTLASFVPTMLTRLLDADWHVPDTAHAFRFALMGGAKVTRELREECRRRRIDLVCSYGMTESCSHITATRPGQQTLAGEGQPLLHAQVAIRDEAGLPPPSREAGRIWAGRIWLRGPQLGGGQGRPAAPWHATGDIGYLDAQGALHVLARQAEVYISGGANVYAPEVTTVLEMHPAVQGAWVTGVADREWGHVILALAEPRPQCPVTETALRSHCRQRLPAYKVPKKIFLVDALPRTSTGKVQHARARQLLHALWP